MEWSERSVSAEFGGTIYDIARIAAIATMKDRTAPYELYPHGLVAADKIPLECIFSEVVSLSNFHQATVRLFWRDGPWAEAAFLENEWVPRIWLALGGRVDFNPLSDAEVQRVCRAALAPLLHRLLGQIVQSPNWVDATARPTPSRLATALDNIVAHLRLLVPFPGLVEQVASDWSAEQLNAPPATTPTAQAYQRCLEDALSAWQP